MQTDWFSVSNCLLVKTESARVPISAGENQQRDAILGGNAAKLLRIAT